ncbi:MAG TPA: hypothetical protein VGY57_00225 [Vicinamibacterales bacterium]|jgi:hypothetical protein|nr:hypothetical protein [Vicinamibacterales bacterium]
MIRRPRTRMTVESLKRHVDRRFAVIDRRFASIDRRFADVDRRFADFERRFDSLSDKMDALLKIGKRNADIASEGLRVAQEQYAHSFRVLDDHEGRIQALEKAPSPH